jgi:aspartyl-tRNA(Asn)/glutamyl-tRNA(Gln) amidotransferase subunit B
MKISYQPVIGLEVHIQLSTNSKAYSSDSTKFGMQPNTNVSVVTLGHPGALPKVNEKVIEHAVMLGIACHCEIRKENHYARKNYFYADLPKGYQITQDKTPVCNGGYVSLKSGKKVNLTRIHMEEDAGKSIHDQDIYDSLIDLNRAGVPLLEMVSEPDIRSSNEAYDFLTEVRKLVTYLGICDGNMEEGSLRCDANISIMPEGSAEFGVKVEVKNMNSIRNVQRAIEFEIGRQTELLNTGEVVSQETRSFDAVTGTTFSLRGKEQAHDYRYFPEPDLPPVVISNQFIESVKNSMPSLPYQLQDKMLHEFGLSLYDTEVLTENKEMAHYYIELTKFTSHYKASANWMMGPVKSYLNETACDIVDFPVNPEQLSKLIDLTQDGKVSFSAASQRVFPELIKSPESVPESIAEHLNLITDSNLDSIETSVNLAISRYPDKVAEYKAGKTGLLGLFMGEVMKITGGKADPRIASLIIKQALEKN